MRKILLLGILWGSISLGACCTAREKAFHDGVDQLVNKSGLLSEYEKYVESDPSIKAETKKIRKETATSLRNLIEEEKKALEE